MPNAPLNFLLRMLKSFSKVFILDRLNEISSRNGKNDKILWCKLLTQKSRNFGITWFSKQAPKKSRSSLHFRKAKSIFSNF